MKLTGKSIVVTRATHQFAEIALYIERNGGNAVSYPTIAIHTAPVNPTDYDTIKHLMSGAYDWVVFTSVNAVTKLAEYAQHFQRIVAIHPETQIAAIGAHTVQRIRILLQREVNLTPTTANAVSLFGELKHRRPNRVCWVCGNLANPPQTPFMLDTLVVYHTVCATDGPAFATIQSSIDAITFQSGSAVHNFVTRMQHEQIDLASLRGVCFAYQGATAYRAAHVLNLPRHFYSESTDSATFIDQLADQLAQEHPYA
jgi:uroporphyrinogen-III synthase